MNRDTLYFRLSAALFLIVTAVVLWTFRDYGASWDELLQQNYGELVLRYYTSFLRDRSAFFTGDLYHYGGFFEVLSVFAAHILPFGVYEARHLISALCGIAGLLACWKLVRFLAGPGAAFWAAFLLTLYPSYYGHMFINSKDIPFAVLYMWSLYYLIRLLDEFPAISMNTAGKLGIASGLTMAVRAGGLILLCYLYLFIAVSFAYLLLYKRESLHSIPMAVRRAVAGVALTTVIAYAVMLLFWPYALGKPFVRPFATLGWLSSIKDAASTRDYVPRYLVLKLPELILALAAIGLCLGMRRLFAKRSVNHFSVTLSYLLLTFSILFPVIYVLVKRPFLYDEIRHFLFVIPPLFCLAGITMDAILEWASRRDLAGKVVFAVLAVYLLLHVRLMVGLHPYEYSYYNRFIGGVYGAYQSGYDPEYWATSYKEGVQKLRDYLIERDGPEFDTKRYKILAGPAEWCATYYFPRNFLLVTDASEADIYLSPTREKSDTKYAGLEAVAVRRFEAPFAIAKIMRKLE